MKLRRAKFSRDFILFMIVFLVISIVYYYSSITSVDEIYVDVYTGRLRFDSKRNEKVISERTILATAGTLYKDYFNTFPQNEKWELVKRTEHSLFRTNTDYTSYNMAQFQFQNALAHLLNGIGSSIYKGPKGGFTQKAKERILLNSLIVLRESRSGHSAEHYVWKIATILDGFEGTAEEKDVEEIDIQEFLEH